MGRVNPVRLAQVVERKGEVGVESTAILATSCSTGTHVCLPVGSIKHQQLCTVKRLTLIGWHAEDVVYRDFVFSIFTPTKCSSLSTKTFC